METNACDVNHLNADALLPPRKRLLAGLKRQNSDLNSPAPSTSNNGGSEYDVRLNNLLRAHLSNPNLSNEEIIETSKLAALEAAKVAEAARASAEEKAAIAAKAVAAAKTALDLVVTLSEEAAGEEKCSKKNKMKKHVPVQTLYNKNKGLRANCRTDEELARNLHRAINSSPRIFKNTGGDDTKTHKHKKLKTSVPSARGSYHNGVSIAGFSHPLAASRNGNGQLEDVDLEDSAKESDMVTVDLNSLKFDKGDQFMLINGEGSGHSKAGPLENGESEMLLNGRYAESSDSSGKKKARNKQKKLPLSICSFRYKTSPKEDLKSRTGPNSEENSSRSTMSKQPSLSLGTSGNSLTPVEKTSLWKCQSFKAATCIKQNKVIQS